MRSGDRNGPSKCKPSTAAAPDERDAGPRTIARAAATDEAGDVMIVGRNAVTP